jgi:hypothetical protein
VLQPSEALRKRAVLVERGSFRPVTHVTLDMMDAACQQFTPYVADAAAAAEVAAAQAGGQNSGGADGGDPAAATTPAPPPLVRIMEVTMRNLLETGGATGEIDYADFLARADVLAATGATVLISDYFEYYRLAAYLRRYTDNPIAMAMGIPSLRELFDEKYYEHLEGGILESFGRLFKNDLKLYIYPLKEDHQLITVPKLKVAPHLQSLYTHLIANGYIESIDFFNKDYLPIFSRDVLAKIAAGDPTWEAMVPASVAQIIKERRFFGYGGEAAAANPETPAITAGATAQPQEKAL